MVQQIHKTHGDYSALCMTNYSKEYMYL